MTAHYLKNLFEPTSVAVFGASEGQSSVGAVVFKNILDAGFKGKLYAINPKHKSVQGRRCYANLDVLNKPIDLAIITTPAHTVPAIINQCGEHSIKAAVVLSAGFREVGSVGRRLEQAVLENAHRYGLRFIGPNCLGVIRADHGLNATFNKGSVKQGNLAFVSQSGALCTAILDWASSRDIGFSTVVSLGISADINFGEILDYLVSDPSTHAILLYVEGIENARGFLSGLRTAARAKPVIIVKAGRHQAASDAAKSHTGALVGADDVFDSTLRRAGVVRGMHVGDLFAAATVLTGGLRANGENLVIVTNAGGPAAMACDKASDLSIPLATLSEDTLQKLDQCLPPMWSHGNPVDVLGDADPERYAQALAICLEDKQVDGAIVILTPQAMTSPSDVAEMIVKLSLKTRKPIITCWMGGNQVTKGRKQFMKADIPTFRLPETAVQGYAYLTSFYRNQQLLLQTPGPLSEYHAPDVGGARLIIEHALAEKRKVLTETEAKAVLAAFHIPITPIAIARDASEALAQAEVLGFPIAMKIYSKQITHKSDIDGVRLSLSNADAVQQAYYELIANAKTNSPDAEVDGVVVESMVSSPHGRELLVGIARDEIFGPVISFGTGGTAVELIADHAVALPPLNQLLIHDLISHTRAARLLEPFRHMPAADTNAIKQVLMRVSEMACELPWIRELDINPLIADEHGVVAVDARIVIDHYSEEPQRYAHMAIHPYPTHLISHSTLSNGVDLTIRPIRPEDAVIERTFVRNLSSQTKYFRFLNTIKELTPEMLARFTQIDYDREMALIALVKQNNAEIEIGVSRYVINADGKSCEFAVVVADDWQHHGIGHKLMEQLIEYARYRGLELMQGDVLVSNHGMKSLAKSLGFVSSTAKDDTSLIQISKRL